MVDPYAAAERAALELARRSGVERHDAVVVLGSGWAGAVGALGTVVADLDARELPGLLAPVAPGHPGRVLSTELPSGLPIALPVGPPVGPTGPPEPDGVRVLVLLGRTHLYEGHGAWAAAHGVRTAAAAGCRTAILTNASGGLRPGLVPGDGVLLTDHLDLAGASPLRGPRFVDLTHAYSARLRALARAGSPGLAEGVYAMLRGPHFETVAEARALRALGADLVGMSTVPEVIAAREAGLDVLALSVVSAVEPLTDDAPGVDADEVVRVAAEAAARLGPTIATVLVSDAAERRADRMEA